MAITGCDIHQEMNLLLGADSEDSPRFTARTRFTEVFPFDFRHRHANRSAVRLFVELAEDLSLPTHIF
jgi:hypothetical protein